MKTKLLIICLFLFSSQVFAEECVEAGIKGVYSLKWNNCIGTKWSLDDGSVNFIKKNRYPSSKEYDGEFKDGLYDGYGTLTYLEYGLKVGEFTGEFRNNKRYKGTLTYFDNGLYVGKFTGEFRNNKRYKGIIINALGNEKKFELKTSNNNQEIIGMWHLVENIGGISRFDWAHVSHIITIKEESLYKAFVMSYRWRSHDGCRDAYYYHDGTECFRNKDPNECSGADETKIEMVCGPRYSGIEFLPTEYYENKISNFESEKHFVINVTGIRVEPEDENKNFFETRYKLTRDRYFRKLLWSQKEKIECMQKNINEVLFEEQIFQRRDNLDISRIPKIWSCIYPEPSQIFFK